MDIFGGTKRKRAQRFLGVTAAASVMALVSTSAFGADTVTLTLMTQSEIRSAMQDAAPLQAKSKLLGYPAQPLQAQADWVDKIIPRSSVLSELPSLGVAPSNGSYIWRELSYDSKILLGYGLYDHEPVYEEAATYCARNYNNCAFVGGLDLNYAPYPAKFIGENMWGQGPGSTMSYQTSSSVTQTTTQSTGWSVKLTIGSGVVPGFDINRSTTNSYAQLTGSAQNYQFTVPSGKMGRIEARSNGGWYSGYIAVKVNATRSGAEGTTLIPARVLVNSDKVPNTFSVFAADSTAP
ncbi:hypothetical protein ACWF95_41710 [Streptomyces vinaceus]